MSETPELPPLPNPVYGGFPEYDEEQMRQFWEAGRRAGLEEAAKEAMKLHNTGPRAYVPGEPGYAEACAINSTAVAIAGAIRAKVEKHQPCPRCHGTGRNLMHDNFCGECGGTGRAKP